MPGLPGRRCRGTAARSAARIALWDWRLASEELAAGSAEVQIRPAMSSGSLRKPAAGRADRAEEACTEQNQA